MIDKKLKQIKILLLDADGVLTNGQILYLSNGEEAKNFNVRDGLGIRMLRQTGIKVGIISGRGSTAVDRRASELGIEYCHTGVKDKLSLFDTIIEKAGCTADQAAFVGDDLVDLGPMKKAGIAIAVADAHEIVKKHADIVTDLPGGCGAVREICEKILAAKGLWDEIVQRWLIHI